MSSERDARPRQGFASEPQPEPPALSTTGVLASLAVAPSALAQPGLTQPTQPA
jgi:hypothetical protein